MSESPFYIGYIKTMPKALADWTKRRVWALGIGVAVILVILAVAQSQFSYSNFEYNDVRSFDGVIEMYPYPHVRIDRPGTTSVSRYLLVNPGKFGGDAALQAFNHKHVVFDGKLAYRDTFTLIELVSDSIALSPTQADTSSVSAETVLGQVQIKGEIVDSKCFTGVMNLGNLATHRECAILCIRGGIPPILVSRESNGALYYTVLVTEDGQPINHDVLEFVAEPVTVTGVLSRLDDMEILKVTSIVRAVPKVSISEI